MGKLRKTMLFIPGNNPGMVQNGVVFNSDSVIFDLEDAVSLNEKDTARILLKHALKNIDFSSTEVVVRINGLDSNLVRDDLEAVVQPQLDTILVPKVNTADQIKEIDKILTKLEKENNIEIPIKIIALVETALGVENSFSIAEADKRMTAILFGGEDFTADIRTKRTDRGEEIDYARSRIIVSCRAAKIDAIDTPYSDIDNLECLKKDAKRAKRLGFDGKALISPKQINIVNQIFSPTAAEIDWAKRVVRAIDKAEKNGKGVISLDGKMIDAPIVNRAKRIINIAAKKEGAL